MQKPQERIQRKSVIEVSVNILIAFEDTIRLSVHILIASADTLIVFLNARRNALLCKLFFVVTSSRCHTLNITT